VKSRICPILNDGLGIEFLRILKKSRSRAKQVRIEPFEELHVNHVGIQCAPYISELNGFVASVYVFSEVPEFAVELPVRIFIEERIDFISLYKEPFFYLELGFLVIGNEHPEIDYESYGREYDRKTHDDAEDRDRRRSGFRIRMLAMRCAEKGSHGCQSIGNFRIDPP
jgi:hypothetical protein